MKLILTVGLPISGKSTWARTTGWPIVNPDSIRLALHGQRFYGPAEPMVWAFAHIMVEALRLAGHKTVVLDATNVTAKRRDEWERQYPGAVERCVIDTPMAVCLARATAAGDSEIIPVIERMAKDWDLGGWHPIHGANWWPTECARELPTHYPNAHTNPSTPPVEQHGICIECGLDEVPEDGTKCDDCRTYGTGKQSEKKP